MIRLAGIFIPSVIVLSFVTSTLLPGLFPMLVVDAAALAAVYYYYILWDGRPIRLRCGKCGKLILSNTPWVCGYKECRNERADDFPFVHKCEHCGAEPKAYRCHHGECGNMIILSEDEDTTNFARSINSPVEPPEPDERAEKLKKYKEKKEDKKERIEILKLDEELRTIRKRLRVEKSKTSKEVLLAKVDSVMELEEAGDELKARLAEKFKGNRAKITRWKAAVDDCVARQKAEE